MPVESRMFSVQPESILARALTRKIFPEIVNRVIIAGPAEARLAPVIGATLVITYKKEPNGGAAEETPPPVVISPTPSGTATPSATSIPIFTPIFSPTP